MHAHTTLVDVLRHRADVEPSRVAYYFLADGEDDEAAITYGQLDANARQIAARLQLLPQDRPRAVLLFIPGLDYIAAYMGCLYAGWAPVPAYPPDPARMARTFPRLKSILEEAQPGAILTSSAIQAIGEPLLAQVSIEGVSFISTDVDGPDATDWKPPAISGDTIALVQYTSGSIGQPKGVLVTHSNLLHNLRLIAACGHMDADRRGVCWLPPYHDMGLIGGILNPLEAGYPMTLMSPLHFLMRPVRWVRALSRYRAHITVAPDFAYGLTARKVTEEQKAEMDLSYVETVFNGAEPIRASVMERFIEAFASCGFRREAFLPCYGLAESTLIVCGIDRDEKFVSRPISRAALTSQDVDEPRDDEDAMTVVGCGGPLDRGRILVVDPETRRRLDDGRVGEVWLQSPSVAVGYWNRPEQTKETFRARLEDDPADGPFLRTGDMGFLLDDQLYVVGRLKDLIIIRGQNYYPPDIEDTVERAHGSIRRGCTAALALEIDGEERLAILCEVERRHLPDRRAPEPGGTTTKDRREGTDRRQLEPLPGNEPERPASFDPDAVADAIREAVVRTHEIQVNLIALLKPGSVFKTPSGKVQRRASKKAYLEGELTIFAERRYGL